MAFDGFENSVDFTTYFIEFYQSNQPLTFWLDVKDTFSETNVFDINID
jgi:hypothetical protein